MMFTLSITRLEDIQLRQTLASNQAGALNCFEGRVRNHNDGKSVQFLEYEADEALCKAEALRIFEDVRSRFEIIDAKCFHRVGKLKVGEMAVWVGVLSSHRDEAFKACRYIIDELKKRLPIWKKEYYTDGDTRWVQCSEHHKQTSFSENQYYARQLSLSEIGPSGQEKLKSAKVLVVGAGGLGCSVLTGLANAGAGTIGLVEHDKVELSNLHRQFLYGVTDIGQLKANVAGKRLNALNPSLDVRVFTDKLTEDNVGSMIKNFDYIVDCTDNFKAKFLINDYCFKSKRPLIQASIYQFEGHLRVYNPSGKNGCLRCVWPQIPEDSCLGNCQQAGVIGLVPNVFGYLQAWETIRLICQMPENLSGKTLIMNLRNYETNIITEPRNSSCSLCGANPVSVNIEPEQSFFRNESELDLKELPELRRKDYTFIDIRDELERIVAPIKLVDSIHIPRPEFMGHLNNLDLQDNYILVCNKGFRSLKLVSELHALKLTNFYSLKGGCEALDEFQDPSYA